MLSELRVRDLGVIADLTVELGPGMTVLTGETGAGKTLLVQAVQLVLGGRATAGMVRSGAAEALVEARFSPGRLDDDDIVLARSVSAAGRSRSWVGGRMAPVTALAEAGAALVEIHGQHEHQSLLSGPAQRALLDRFAHSDLAPLASARAALREIERRLAELGGDERDRARTADLLRYQADEIEAARIADAEEEVALRREEATLADVAALQEAAHLALRALDADAGGGGGGADPHDAVERVGAALGALSGRQALAGVGDRLRRLLEELGDVAGELRVVAETLEEDPERLAGVQQRLRLLADLRRKYGDTLDDVMAFGSRARRDLETLEHQAEVVAELEGARSEASAAVAAAALALRDHRRAAAPGLAAAATSRLVDLAMPDARLEVVVGGDGPGDAVALLLGANRGEPVQPLARVASGGELARAMLALRLVVGGGAPTMLFDEVDAGVGGSAALALAGALAEVAADRQVLVVTHLPQVAAFASHQVAVDKALTPDGRTVTTARKLSPEERVVEMSRMLSGHPDSPTARAHAEELLASGRGRRESTTAPAALD